MRALQHAVVGCSLGHWAVLPHRGRGTVQLELVSVIPRVFRSIILAMSILIIFHNISTMFPGGLFVVEPQVLVDLVLVRTSDIWEAPADIVHGCLASHAHIGFKVIAGLI